MFNYTHGALMAQVLQWWKQHRCLFDMCTPHSGHLVIQTDNTANLLLHQQPGMRMRASVCQPAVCPTLQSEAEYLDSACLHILRFTSSSNAEFSDAPVICVDRLSDQYKDHLLGCLPGAMEETLLNPLVIPSPPKMIQPPTAATRCSVYTLVILRISLTTVAPLTVD